MYCCLADGTRKKIKCLSAMAVADSWKHPMNVTGYIPFLLEISDVDTIESQIFAGLQVDEVV